MHDPAHPPAGAVTGLAPVPTGTLVDRALDAMAAGPVSAERLSRDVFGLISAPAAVADRLAVALLGSDPRARRLADGRWSRVVAALGSPLIEECAFAAVDVETTGSRSRGVDRISEVAVVLVQGARCQVVLESLVNPERPMPAAVVAVTGITEAMVRAAPVFGELTEHVLGALAGRVFVAHNARFDWAFLGGELRRARALALEGPRLCTVRLARALVPGLGSYSLDAVAEYFGVENPARHRAAGDALALGRILLRLLELARGRDARTLADLERLQARRRRRRGRRRSATEDAG
jgi:DNA polymerase-3 subunit epsilon